MLKHSPARIVNAGWIGKRVTVTGTLIRPDRPPRPAVTLTGALSDVEHLALAGGVVLWLAGAALHVGPSATVTEDTAGMIGGAL